MRVRAFIRIIYKDHDGLEHKIGTLEAGHDINRKSYISENELQILKALGNLAAIAIYNAKMSKRVEKLKNVEILEKISQKIAWVIPHKMISSAQTIEIDIGKLIKETKNDDKLYELLGKRLSRISTCSAKILDFLNKLNSSSVPKDLAIEIVDLNSLLTNCKNNFSANDSIDIRIEIEPGTPKIEIDKREISDAIIECMSNAVDFLPKDNAYIKISVSLDNENNNFVKINISDNGKGVPLDFKERIFSMFVSKRESMPPIQRIYSGFGLGLSFVKGICQWS